MSLLLNQPSKLWLRKPVLVRSSAPFSNGLSSSLPQNPMRISISSTDPSRPELVNISCQFSKELLRTVESIEIATARREMLVKEKIIGSSHGWVATLKDDGLVRLQDELIINALNLSSEPKHIPLPPFVTLPHCQTQIVTNLAMSSSSPEHEDCVLAVKFMGPQLSFCRPAQSNPEWTNIRIANPCFFSSSVLYSEKDDMFRIPGSGGHLIGSWHLHTHIPKFQRLRFKNLPKLTKTQRDLLDSCYKSQHLAESRATGEIFLVKWYKKTSGKIIKGVGKMKTIAIMVFRIDEQGNAVYTQDIGNIIIYLTKSDPLCVISRGPLPPNRVYVVDVDETIGMISLSRLPFGVNVRRSMLPKRT